MTPLVSIIILSWNRKDDLRSSLSQVYAIDYPAYEVIVVDNNSSDGSVDMLRSEFPLVIVVALDHNIGIAGWKNAGKTTLAVRLVEEFSQRGLRVATIKHARTQSYSPVNVGRQKHTLPLYPELREYLRAPCFRKFMSSR